MKIKEKFQKEFCNALQNRSLHVFMKENQRRLVKIGKRLKEVNFRFVQGSSDEQLKFVQISEFLSHNFIKLLEGLPSSQLPDCQNKQVERDFYKEMHAAYSTGNWQQFYTDHEAKFDYIIELARQQKVANFKLKRNKKQYYFFKDARIGQNPRSVGLRKHLLRKSDKVVKIKPDLQSDSSGLTVHRDPPVKIQETKKQEKEKKKKALRDFDETLNRVVASGSGPVRASEQVPKSSYQFTRQIRRSPSISSNSSDYWESRRKKMDESFQVKSNAQFERHQETMRTLREERQRINREAEEHVRKMKEESALRMKFFLECVRLKMRWEDQENEWDTWLTSAREPIMKVKNRFRDFTCKSYEMVKREFEDELKLEFLQYQKYVQIAYYKMQDDFEGISTLSGSHENRLFLKVLKRKFSDMAEKLRRLLEAVEDFEDHERSFESIKSEEGRIHPWDIPTAAGLRRICETAREEDYEFVDPPKRARRGGPVITEV